MVTPEGQVQELGGRADSTTNNRMELMAVIEALRLVASRTEDPVDLYTDSTYVIRGATQWMWAWKKRGWTTAEGKPVLNQDLWERLESLLRARPRSSSGRINWKWVKGHAGNPGNERVDRLAVAFSQDSRPGLYRGPLLQYSVDVMDLPEAAPLPEMKPIAEKKVAHCYLSQVGGTTRRHRDWSSCERWVKGQSGAKFKKAMSPEDEQQILADWGVDPSRVQNVDGGE